MSLRCAVCGRQSADVKEHRTISGTRYGMACVGECQGLLWEAHFVRATGGDDYSHALILWGWRRRRAEVEGRTFLEEPPKSKAERELDALIEAHGLGVVAREVA